MFPKRSKNCPRKAPKTVQNVMTSTRYKLDLLELRDKRALIIQVILFEIDWTIFYTNLHMFLSDHKLKELGKFW